MTMQTIQTGASAEAIQSHYDLSNDFYGLWLDEHMVYSGAFYANESDSLEHAQLQKIDHHLREARAEGAGSLLEIGCGWGALLRRATTTFGVSRAMGLTLSQAQVDYIRQRALPNVQAKLENWQDHRPEQPYDAIVSIGAFEHFAKIEYDDSQKVAAYRSFFKRCQEEFLKPGGHMSLQTFAYGSTRSRAQAMREPATAFLAQEIFRETDPPSLANIAEAVSPHFEVVALRNDRLHYARTLREWMTRLKARRPQAVAMVGEEAVARYERYLQYSFIGFQTGNLDLYRITLRRIDLPWRKRGQS